MDTVDTVLTLKITVATRLGENEDDVYKYLCDILYNYGVDITDVEECE